MGEASIKPHELWRSVEVGDAEGSTIGHWR